MKICLEVPTNQTDVSREICLKITKKQTDIFGEIFLRIATKSDSQPTKNLSRNISEILNFFASEAVSITKASPTFKEAIMCYAAAIRAYIAKVPLNVIFSTREVLNLGTRAAVDLTLSRMVKARTLIRVARGLFVREGSIIPGAAAIAKAKALAFGRSIASHGSNEARRFGFDKGASDFAKFCIGGGSSSFLTIHERVNFAGTCDRKRHLGDSAPGKVIRGFWYMGKDKFLEVAGHCINSLPLQEQTNVAVNAAWMPAWMSDQFIRRANSGPISISVKSLPPVSNSPQS